MRFLPDLIDGDITGVTAGTGLSGGGTSGDVTLNVDASIPEITTLAGLTTIGATGVNTLISSDDVQMYNPVINGNPSFAIGASATEHFRIWAKYDSGAQTLDNVEFKSYAASGTANKGVFKFIVDEVNILDINDDGVNLRENMGITIAATDILTDSSGTATLSNIDALDAATEVTIEAAVSSFDAGKTFTTTNALTIDADALTTGSALVVDVDDALTTSATKSLVKIDYDKAGVTASGQTSTTTGLDINMADAATNHASGRVTMTGAQIDLDSANAQGVITQKGLVLNVAADGVGDVTSGIEMEVMDGGTDIKMMSHANTADYCTIATTTNGATAITTVEDGVGATAHFRIGADGDITLDSAGQIKLEPVAGNNILLDGTIAVDAGVVTGATSITSTAFVGGLTGQADTVATIAGLAPNTATTQATQPAIESIGTDGDTLNILGDNLQMSNTTASKPAINLFNQADDATGPVILFQNQRIDSTIQAGEDDDILGTVNFKGYNDGTPAIKTYSQIYSDIHDATTGEESGRLTFRVANHDGGLGSGLILTGGSEDNEVDVTVGLGANSVVTVPGQILAPNGGMGTRHYGSTIKILPSDFMINDDAAVPLSFKDGTNSGVHINDTANEAIAFVTIPEGMKATAVDIYATHNKTVEVWEVDVNSSLDFTATANETGAANTQITVDPNINATATNYLAIIVSLTATSNRIWGGLVTIAAQ